MNCDGAVTMHSTVTENWAYKGDPKTGEPVDRPANANETDSVAWVHDHQIWDLDKVNSVITDQSNAISFFCGGSRNFSSFADLFDEIFVLDVDLGTLNRRLTGRPEDEFGGKPIERDPIVRLHATRESIQKDGVVIDATAPIEHVVDEILEKCNEVRDGRHFCPTQRKK